MKLLILIFVAVYAASAVPLEGPQDYPRYVQFPGGDGNLHEVDLEAEPDLELLSQIEKNPANNVYLLFTKSNPTSPQILVNSYPFSILTSNFNPRHPTVVIAHGWLSNQNSDLNPVLRDAYLEKGDTNVIILDWRRLAVSGYTTAVRGVPAVGRGLGQFLQFLHFVTGAPFSSMHLVGFSLGAHLVGNAGRELGGRVARVTGLDPAGPLWSYNSNRLQATDGVYVEGIHTDGGTAGLGIGSNVGDADFYANGGNSQPGCLISTCNHSRAWELFAASIRYNHLYGIECSSNLQITWNSCKGAPFPMGNDDLGKRGTGMYRVNTGRNYPF